MQVLEQILEEIDTEIQKQKEVCKEEYGTHGWNIYEMAMSMAKGIICRHLADDGWIPVESGKKPPTKGYIYLSFANSDLPMVGRYEEDEEGGTFYVGDDEESCISQDMIVNAWKPVDKPYRPKEEE